MPLKNRQAKCQIVSETVIESQSDKRTCCFYRLLSRQPFANFVQAHKIRPRLQMSETRSKKSTVIVSHVASEPVFSVTTL